MATLGVPTPPLVQFSWGLLHAVRRGAAQQQGIKLNARLRLICTLLVLSFAASRAMTPLPTFARSGVVTAKWRPRPTSPCRAPLWEHSR